MKNELDDSPNKEEDVCSKGEPYLAGILARKILTYLKCHIHVAQKSGARKAESIQTNHNYHNYHDILVASRCFIIRQSRMPP